MNAGPNPRAEAVSASAWYPYLRGVAKAISATLVRLEVRGLENVPRSGPCFLIANHQSVLDPVLVQGACDRPVHSFTKSSQFSSSGLFVRWLLLRVNAIPVRRYRIDPQAVRTALRVLEAGGVVGIYPEGERSWDGTLQPLRRGTVRLILKAGVPVVPCGVAGSFGAWPRWTRRPNRVPVRIRFGRPLRFERHDTRPERDAALDGALERLTAVLARLSDQDAAVEGARPSATDRVGPGQAPPPSRPLIPR